MMTALKALLTGILCLLLLALLAGIVFLSSLFLGFELKSLIMPLVALAALVVLFFAGRRLWLYLAGRRFRKTVLATDTRKVASQVVDEANANAMEEACRAGLAHMDAMSLGRNPWCLSWDLRRAMLMGLQVPLPRKPRKVSQALAQCLPGTFPTP